MIWELDFLQKENQPKAYINRKGVIARPKNYKYRTIIEVIKEVE